MTPGRQVSRGRFANDSATSRPCSTRSSVQLSAPDDAAVSHFREQIPEDPLLFRLVPWRAVATD